MVLGTVSGSGEEGGLSAAARAYGALKDGILMCTYPPGSTLNEGRLAEALNVSKTPIREALATLVHEGFVEVLPRQGYRVTDLTLSDVQEIFNLRLLLEPAAAAMAAEHASPEQLQALRNLVENDLDLPDDRSIIAANRAFYAKLAEASGNARLAATLIHLNEEMQRLYLSGLDLRSSIDQQHEARRDLMTALLKGNHHLAHDIAVRQIEASRERVMESLLAAMSATNPAHVKLNLTARRSGAR